MITFGKSHFDSEFDCFAGIGESFDFCLALRAYLWQSRNIDYEAAIRIRLENHHIISRR